MHEFESGVFTNNEEAWHGLGVVLEDKLYDLDKALEVSGLDWTVSKKPLAYVDPETEGVVDIPGFYSLVRDTDNKVLNPCVGSKYVPLQNTEAFRFFEPFLHEKDCFITSAVSLQEGKKICVVAQIEDNIREVVPNDTVEAYMLLCSSHDGSSKTVVKFTKVRTVCMNTLQAALASGGAFRKVSHTSSQQEKLNSIQASVNLFKKDFEEEVLLYKQLAAKDMDLDATRTYLEKLLEKELEVTAKSLNIPLSEFKLEDNRFAKKCLENYMFSEDLQTDSIVNTGWAAFNAVTEAIKTRSNNSDNRLTSIWFGADGKLIERAKHLALSI